MSICSSSARALSRSRIHPTKTLFPFLYQTQTIQQWQSATRPIARRNITSRSRPYKREDIPFERGDVPFEREDIPFEGENLPPAIDQEPPRKTTITGTERAAFQKLYRKFNTEERQQNEKDRVLELDQIADEYYEDDEDHSKLSLDQVFDQALRAESRLRASRTVPQRSKTRTRPPTEDNLHAELGNARSSKRKGLNMDAAKFKEMRLAERERIDKLISNAPTDRALWQTLEREVFTKVRDLDLDNASSGRVGDLTSKASSGTAKKSTKSKTAYKPDPPSTDARVLFQNYPHHLITAISTLRTEFPASPLPFSILPTIKRLGRSSHALGATTTLYKHLIRTAWIQQSSYTTINKLLAEMDDSAIEFDADIVALLDAIIKEHNQARSSVLGKEISLVYSMEMFVDGLKKIATWRDLTAERLGIKSVEKRAGNTIVRRMVPQEQKAWRGVWFQGKAADTQSPRARPIDSASEYTPLVEGTNSGMGGSHAETPFAEDGERTDPFKDRERSTREDTTV